MPFVSLPPPAFIPRCSHIGYDTNGVRLVTVSNSKVSGCSGATYVAPVLLPDHATINSLEIRAHDTATGVHTEQISLKMLRVRDNVYEEMVKLMVPLTAPGDYDIKSIVHHPVIDNGKYGYVLQLNLRGVSNRTRRFYSATIEYT